MRISVPRRLEESSVFPWREAVWDYVDESELILDFSQLNYAFPFGTLILAATIRGLNKHRELNGLNILMAGIDYSISAHSYLGHIGFFKFIGLESGNEPGQAFGSPTYIPITFITRRQLFQQNPKNMTILGAAVQREAERLSRIVLAVNKPLLGHPVPYCFREVIRNTFEHGETNTCIVSAQRWYDNTLEIAIIDFGRGIRDSLSERFTMSSDIEAIRYAIKPGVSRVDTSIKTDDIWANSGFGLYVLSRLSRETGHFLICSGNAALYADNHREIEPPYRFNGTAVKLMMARPRGVNVGEYIDRIIREGEEIASQESRPVRASKSTKSLSPF
jgi:hypothetical protein